MKMKRLVVGLILVSLLGCAYHPKEYKKTHPGRIPADKAREQIGENTTFGIISAIFGTIAGLSAINHFLVAQDFYGDGDRYERRSKGLYLSQSERDAYKALGDAADDEAGKSINNFLLWTGATALLINASIDCFKASSEWEGELDKVRQTMMKTLPYQNLVQTFAH